MTTQSNSESQRLAGFQGRRLGPYLGHNPVSATQIWQWCSVMGDNHPCYRPGSSQLAPPAMMQMWTMRDINHRLAPGSAEDNPYQVFDAMKAMGYASNVAVSYDLRFRRYLRTGEQVRHYSSIVAISEKKTTRLGAGRFVTERAEYCAADDELFAEAFITYFQYAAADSTATQQDRRADGGPHSGANPHEGQRDYPDVDVSGLAPGSRLPRLVIPVTHTLVVGGAIASQDYMPVHHNVPAARAAGMPDIFMNILTTCGLAARYLTDWAGAGGRLNTLRFDLMAPNHPGDVMVLTGEVTALEPQSHGGLATIAFRGENGLGIHTSGTATVSLPGQS